MRSRLAAMTAVLVLTTAGVAAEPPAIPKSEPPQVVFETRVLTVSDTFFERVGLDLDPKTNLLTDAQLSTLLEAAQGDRRANILQAPKVTADSGQEMVVRTGEQQTFVTGVDATRVKGETVLVPRTTTVELGETFTLCGRVTADRKAVAARVKFTSTALAGPVEMIPVVANVTPVFEGGARGKPVPVTQYIQSPKVETATIEAKDLSIPAGGHALLVGPARTREARQEFGPPTLSKIPYLNRMFKNVGVGRETTRTVLVVSATVLESE